MSTDKTNFDKFLNEMTFYDITVFTADIYHCAYCGTMLKSRRDKYDIRKDTHFQGCQNFYNYFRKVHPLPPTAHEINTARLGDMMKMLVGAISDLTDKLEQKD